jgi:hypothetical protein
MVPNWDSQYFIQEEYNVNYYNFVGSADLHTTFQAEKRNTFQNWVDYSGSVIYFEDIYAEISVGKDISGHSSSIPKEVGPQSANSSNKYEQANWASEDPICEIVLSEYTSKPPVVFKGCVSGTLYARFCPSETYNFSFNFD